MVNISFFPPTCPTSSEVDNDSNTNLRKASSREFSQDNYLYSPATTDLKDVESKIFQWHWNKGEPVIVRDVLKTTLGLSWEPMVMWHAFRQIKNENHPLKLDVTAINCLNRCEESISIYHFFDVYLNIQFDNFGWPKVLKLKDWPPSSLFNENMSRHCAEFLSCLSFKHYTYPGKSLLNLAINIPENYSNPDLGPKLGRGDSVTKLHCNMSDTVNVQTHTYEVKLNSTTLRKVEKLKRQHRAQDEREIFGNSKIHCQTVEEELESTKETDDIDSHENAKSIRKECKEVDGSALWDIFRREDVPKVEEYLKKHFKEFRN